MLALNRTNDAHRLRNAIIAMAAFLYNSERCIQAISKLARLLCKAFVGRNDDEITQLLLSKVTRLNNLRGEFVNRDVEETLDLAGMHVHSEHAMRPGNRNAVCNQAGGDRHTRLIFLVGAAISIVGDDSGDARSGGPFERIDHDEQFHNGAVDRGTEGLNDEYIVAAHIINDFDKDIFVAKLKNIGIAKWNAQVLADGDSQRAIGIPAKDTQVVHVHVRKCCLSALLSLAEPNKNNLNLLQVSRQGIRVFSSSIFSKRCKAKRHRLRVHAHLACDEDARILYCHALDAILHVEQLGTRELVFDVATSSNVDFDHPCSADSGYNRLTDLERGVIDQVVVCAESLHLLQQQLPRYSFHIAVDEVFEATLLGQRDGHRLANRPHRRIGRLREIGKLYRADGSGTGGLRLLLQILRDLRYQDLFSLCSQCIYVRRGYYLMAGKDDTLFTRGLSRLGAGFAAA